MNSVPSSPDDKRKDTSLPGREEEVIVNTEVQKQATNALSPQQSTPTDSVPSNIPGSPHDLLAEDAFKEGLADNSHTEKSNL